MQKNNSEDRKIPGRRWPDWFPLLANYRNSDNRKAVWQLVNTLLPYFGLWFVMIRSIELGYSYLLTLILALAAAGFLVRTFILFHDCVHGSFFTSMRANNICGYLLGVLVFTASEDWRFGHLRHHSSYANLDARGFGDIWTLTLQEYEVLAKKDRLKYRLYRNPVVMYGLGAIFLFLLANRLPTPTVKKKERTSVYMTNLLIVIVALIAAWLIGWQTYLMIQLPILWFAGAMGIWLFYVQHQFAGGYWARRNEWDPLRAAMEGSSFYQLPTVLRWFSSNIGYHHVHHLGPRIPNYRLKKCYEAVPGLQSKKPLTISESLSTIRVKLWDEERKEMISFP